MNCRPTACGSNLAACGRVRWKIGRVDKLRGRCGQAPRDRLSGAGPKPLQAAAVKRRGRERWSKSSRITLSRCVLMRRTAVIFSKMRRFPERRRQNQGRFDLLGPACREPDDWTGGDRRTGGVTPTQAFVRNRRNQSLRCRRGDTTAVLGVRPGSGIRHQGSVRQHRPCASVAAVRKVGGRDIKAQATFIAGLFQTAA